MNNQEMASKYDPKTVEKRWYAAWEAAGLFQPDSNSNQPTYTITIPPPNITGSLHMGHSLCYPVQDLLGRYKKLRGFNVLIVPGQDHAGIATQSVVSKQLAAQGIKAHELGREKFLKKVWEWRGESGSTILEQFRALGCAFDWSKTRFTLDEGYVKAVLSIFIDWYKRGLIYRGKRIVNWDPTLLTSVSDIETERKVINGKLYHIRYPYADGSGEIIVATTRPETMLGDVAVAVHPSDERYQGKHGRTLILPLVGREIPLVADPYPDPTFGTGAVKITPAHDPNDYEVGVRQGLEMPIVLDERAKVCADGPYFGLDRYEARKRIINDLEEQGFLVKIEDHQIAVTVSDRSKEVIEPLLSEQWFVKQTELAAPGIKAVEEGQITFFPERYKKVYLDWMENIRDWCISRQLWWGHRIPVYYTEDGTPFAALSWDDAQIQAGDQKIVRQDDDVLDTWFSSGLWPFATLGWPDQDEALRHQHYPTSTLVTDRGIIYLWVARMIMMGLDQMGQVPFREVYVHATVLNEEKKRMSKSLGTGVDPRPVIEEFGADSLRFTLLSQSGMNQEIIYSDKRVAEAKNLCNKIWNAARFVLMNVQQTPGEPTEKQPEDQWILSRLATIEAEAKTAYEGYDMMAAANGLADFFWYEVCDWYIEIAKPRLQNPETAPACQWVLITCLDAFCRMMHPVMPFLTEEVYSFLPIEGKSPFVATAGWPEEVARFKSEDAETRVGRWLRVVRALRALRADLELDPRKAIAEAYWEGDLQGGEAVLASQAWIADLKPGKPEGPYVSTTLEGVDLHIPTAEINKDKILEKLDRDIPKMTEELEKASGRLGDPLFKERAKPEVIEKLEAQVADLKDRLTKSIERRQRLR